jgi:hypothetical protein
MSTHQNRQAARKAAAIARQQQVQKPKPKPELVLGAYGNDHAPVVYFDGAVAYGLGAGSTGRVELATTCSVPITRDGQPGAITRTVVTVHLRAGLEAFAQLADAIEAMLTMVPKLPEPAAEVEPVKEAAE